MTSIPNLVVANVVWPALYFEIRMLSWWAIAIGLLIEFLVLLRAFKLSYRRALVIDFTMNLISAVLGIALLPLAGIAFEFFPGSVLYPLLKVGTFNPITWAATFVLAFGISTAIEYNVVRRIFKIKVSKRQLIWLLLANMFSALCVFISFALVPTVS